MVVVSEHERPTKYIRRNDRRAFVVALAEWKSLPHAGLTNRQILSQIVGRDLSQTEVNTWISERFYGWRDRILSLASSSIEVTNAPQPKRISFSSEAERIAYRAFYSSYEWRALRVLALKRSRGCCELCGATSRHTVLHVDHIKPRSTHPNLALQIANLQVMCIDCNLGKSNWDESDWRVTPAARDRTVRWAIINEWMLRVLEGRGIRGARRMDIRVAARCLTRINTESRTAAWAAIESEYCRQMRVGRERRA